MDFSEIYGFIAMSVSVISFLPVIYTIYKTKKTNNFPFHGVFLALFAQTLWVTYGIYKNALATIISGILYFSMYSFILYIQKLNINENN